MFPSCSLWTSCQVSYICISHCCLYINFGHPVRFWGSVATSDYFIFSARYYVLPTWQSPLHSKNEALVRVEMNNNGSLWGGIGAGCPGTGEYDHEGSLVGRVSWRDKCDMSTNLKEARRSHLAVGINKCMKTWTFNLKSVIASNKSDQVRWSCAI